jgi:hypothetical protein
MSVTIAEDEETRANIVRILNGAGASVTQETLACANLKPAVCLKFTELQIVASSENLSLTWTWTHRIRATAGNCRRVQLVCAA